MEVVCLVLDGVYRVLGEVSGRFLEGFWQMFWNKKPYRGVLKTRWHARVQGGFEGYVRDIWRKFGGHLGVFETTRRLPRGKIKNCFTVLFLS